MSDRRLGYIILGFLTIFIGVVIGVFVWVTVIVPQKHVFEFNQIGNLKIGDPVLMRGVLIGSVLAVEWKQPSVYITIETTKPFSMHPGYTIINIDKGFMGERTIQLDPGDTVQNALSDSDTLHGIFYAGIADALSNIHKLKNFVLLLENLARELRYGTPQKKSLIVQINQIVLGLDTISATILSTTESAGKTITMHLDQLNNSLDSVHGYPRQISNTITPGTKTIQAELNNLDTVTGTVSTMLDSLQTLTAFVQVGDTASWNSALISLRTDITALKQGIDYIRTNGLVLKANLTNLFW